MSKRPAPERKKPAYAAAPRRPQRIPFAEFRLHDPEGNGIDTSVKGFILGRITVPHPNLI